MCPFWLNGCVDLKYRTVSAVPAFEKVVRSNISGYEFAKYKDGKFLYACVSIQSRQKFGGCLLVK